MGLDMYLHANRYFDPDSDVGREILSAAGTTIADLDVLAKDEWESGLYLPRWDFSTPEERAKALATIEAAGLTPFSTDESMGSYLTLKDEKLEVQLTAIYWRKANAIHAWFVDTVQDGVDECQESPPVSRGHLSVLRGLCEDAAAYFRSGNKDSAGALLPSRAGFFFGSTEIDEWWSEDVKRTIGEIDRVLAEDEKLGNTVVFTYRSSW